MQTNQKGNMEQMLNNACDNFKQEFKHYISKEQVLKYVPQTKYVRYQEKINYNSNGEYLSKTGQLKINMYSKQEARQYLN